MPTTNSTRAARLRASTDLCQDPLTGGWIVASKDMDADGVERWRTVGVYGSRTPAAVKLRELRS